MRLRVETVDEVQVVRLEGELDKLAVEQVRGSLDRLVGGGEVVLDLDRLTFIDSAGLHTLFALGRSLAGGIAVAVGEASPTARVIALVHLDDMLPVRGSVADAVSALRRAAPRGGVASESAVDSAGGSLN